MEEKDITGCGPVPKNIVFKAMKSICKIIIENEGIKIFGTGFFMRISDDFKCLITNYHVLNPKYLIQK